MRYFIGDEKPSIGLFYIGVSIVDNTYKIVGCEEYVDFLDLDSMGEIQPPENHEHLLDMIKYSNREDFETFRENVLYGYNVEDLKVFTIPRGRVFYDVIDRKYKVTTSSRVYGSSKLRNLIINKFNLPGNTTFIVEHEYEFFDEDFFAK